MGIDANSNKTAFAMMILGATMAASIVASLVILGYCFWFGVYPSIFMIYFFVWTISISVITWRLDAHLYVKEKKP